MKRLYLTREDRRDVVSVLRCGKLRRHRRVSAASIERARRILRAELQATSENPK